MVSLIDANVIIRFLVQENSKHYKKSVEILSNIEDNSIKVEILSEVVMEVLFIMTKYYHAPLSDIVEDVKSILLLDGIVNENKYILISALNMMESKNIDYVDALICTKAKLEGYGKISFDKDVMKKCKK